MNRVRSSSAWTRARRPRLARALPLALACALMLVMGPLAALALGKGTQAAGTKASGKSTKATATRQANSGGGGLAPVATNSALPTVPTVPTTPTVATTPTVPTTPTTPTTTTPAGTTAGAPKPIAVPKNNPFSKRGMWIWELPSTDGGNISKIISQAESSGIKTLYIKSADGTGNWSQFNSTVVQKLHAAGIKVCAWQYVYGVHPAEEAQVADQAVGEGADCLVVDAEAQYQGKYVQAQTYMTDLRGLVGANFPIALAGLPYIGYHPNFPYSVFLGPGGAQYNLPQMYWRDIGDSVATTYAVTYTGNEIYRRPIDPLGQSFASMNGLSGTAQQPSANQIREFNKLARDYGAKSTNWWDWQSASSGDFKLINQVGKNPKGFKKDTAPTTVTECKKSSCDFSDLVIWAQQYLDGWITRNKAYEPVKKLLTIDGDFGPATLKAVKAFQAFKHLSATGKLNGATWDALLKAKPVAVKWVKHKTSQSTKIATAAGFDGAVQEPVPATAQHKTGRDELHRGFGQGRP